jgi:hypothetical protein
VLAGPLIGADLYMARAPGTPPPGAWIASSHGAVRDVLVPILHTGALAGAPVWAVAAITLPWLLRRRSPLAAAVLAIVWASATLVATEVAVAIADRPAASAAPRAAVLGAAASIVVALSPHLLTRLRLHAHAASPPTEFP